MLYCGNCERVFPYCIPIPSIDGSETFRQLREKLLKEFPELTPENYFTFSPAEMTAKVRSFGNTTPRSSISHEISTKVERGLVMWFASQLIRRFIHHKRFANTYSVTCRFAFQSLSTAIRATRQQGAEISMETNQTVANLHSDSAHDIPQVYKQIHTCTYTFICTNTYIASVSPCRLPVTSYVTSQCRS